MITDRELTCSDSQAITAIGTAVSTDVVRLRGIFAGRPNLSGFRAYAQVDEAFVTAAGGTLNIQVVQADNAALTTNAEVLYQTGAQAAAALPTNGKAFEVDVGMPKTTREFIGYKYVVATGAFTAGRITAGFAPLTPTPLDDRPDYYTGRGA